MEFRVGSRVLNSHYILPFLTPPLRSKPIVAQGWRPSSSILPEGQSEWGRVKAWYHLGQGRGPAPSERLGSPLFTTPSNRLLTCLA